MPSTSSEYRRPKVELRPAEKGAQERRIGRAIQQGMPMTSLMRRFPTVGEAHIKEVAAKWDLQIKNARGKKEWT